MATDSENLGKSGWNISADDPSTARRYLVGRWSAPVKVQEAQLDLLDQIESHLKSIRFRVGFLALVVFLSILVSVLVLLFSSIAFLG